MKNSVNSPDFKTATGRKVAVLYPVVLAVPPERRLLKGREKVRYLSRHARRALALSAGKTGTVLQHLPKDQDGVPLPVNGIHWSLSHKSEFVAAVTASRPVGIDIEAIRPCSEGLFKRIAQSQEWSLVDPVSTETFFRFWTAKEAVLKATGIGFKGFSNCRIAQVTDRTHMTVRFMDRSWAVEHLFFDHHIVSIVANGSEIRWTIDKVTHQ